MSDERYSVPQLLNPILFDGNVTMYGFNRTVILTDEMQYYHKSNYTDEQVDFKYIIGMATMLATPSPKQPFSFLGQPAINSARQLFSSVPAGV